jgi:hypothetical protein
LGAVVVARRRNCDFALKSVLGLDPNEAQLYLLVVNSGKKTVSKEKGMFIEIKDDEFESLHPRFALSNRYRRKCNELGIEYGRNDQVDSLAIYLEKYYDLARTK